MVSQLLSAQLPTSSSPRPPGSDSLHSLIFVHGLQGHLRETWTCTKLPSHESSNISKSLTPSVRQREERIVAGDDTPRLSHSIVKPGPLNIFWPQDLLPEDCPDAQIWTWGYDTKVTKGYGASNHNSLFAHARDLPFALKRRRDVGRPLVFVAHSLSRIIVKEVGSLRQLTMVTRIS